MIHFALALSFALLAGLSRAQAYGPQSCVNVGGNPSSFAAVILFEDRDNCYCVPPGAFGFPITVSTAAFTR